MSKKKLELPHPETRTIDTIGVLRFIVDKLNKEEDVEKGALYHQLPGSMTERLKPYDIKCLPEVLLLMQELGVLRLRGATTSTIWFVADIDYFEEFVSEEWLQRANLNLSKHFEASAELRKLRKHVNKVPTDTPPTTNNDDELAKMNENLAEVIAEVERLKGENDKKDARISELEAELQANPKVDPKTVSEELMARFQKLKSA